MRRWWFYGVLPVAALIGVALYLGSVRTHLGLSAEPRAIGGTAPVSNRPRSFSLTDSSGTRVTDQSFKGDWLIVYFGFTHCVDVCPAALFKLSKALEAMGALNRHVQVAFITVDPDRDSPEVLKSYLHAFGPRFTGLTGTPEQINSAEQTFRAYAEKKAGTPDGNYAMNHSNAFYVLDPNGQFRRQISTEAGVDDLAATLRSAMSLNAS